MRVKTKDLPSLGYYLNKELDHSELVPFVKENLRTINPFSIFYWAFNVAAIAALILFLIQEKRLPVFEAVTKLFLGVFLFFVILLPIHELIHALFYRIAGAQTVKFSAQWRKLVFYCIADNFVAGKNSFLLVALTPFFIINSILILLMFMAHATFFYTLYGALILHTGGCFGDFGLVSYFYNNRKDQPVTYDDAGKSKSFFFLKSL